MGENCPTLHKSFPASWLRVHQIHSLRASPPEVSTEEEDGGTVKVVHFGVVWGHPNPPPEELHRPAAGSTPGDSE